MMVQLLEDGGLDWDALMGALKPQTKCALIQRSCRYSWCRSLSIDGDSKSNKDDQGKTIKMCGRNYHNYNFT